MSAVLIGIISDQILIMLLYVLCALNDCFKMVGLFKLRAVYIYALKAITGVQFFQQPRKTFYLMLTGLSTNTSLQPALNRDCEQSTFSTQLCEKQKSPWEKCFLKREAYCVLSLA